MPGFLLGDGAIWNWFTFGTIVLFIELLMPELLPMGLSIASFAFGIISYAFPDIYERLQIGHFLIFATVIILTGYFFINPVLMRGRRFTVVTELGDNHRDKLIGMTGFATEPFHNGVGRADVNGASWKCHGPNMEKGVCLVVKGVTGNRLIVTPVEY